ncbi:MAG: hypothetical protein ACK50A_01565 [Sphingobacteriaceae bacterium]
MGKYKKSKVSKVEEPNSIYLSKNLVAFSSIEQQENYNNSLSAQQSPKERIKETVKLILRIYNTSRTELNKIKNSDRIYFEQKN